MGVNTAGGGGRGNGGNGGDAGKRGNGSDGHSASSPEGSLLDSFIEPLTPNVDLQVIEAPVVSDASTSPPADRKAPVVQLFPSGAPAATPDAAKPYVLELAGAEGTLTATFATFEDAVEAFAYRTTAAASLKYLRDGAMATLAWVEFENDGADAREKYASEQVKQAILNAKQKRGAYHAEPPLPAAGHEVAAAPAVPLPSAPTSVIEQYQRILAAYNCKNGVYRGMFNVKVLEDMGGEIVFHRTSEEATQACVALAIKKGWSAVEIGGTPERKERAWLAYTMAGIKVTNYMPPMHLLERYEAITGGRVGSANVDRPAAELSVTPGAEHGEAPPPPARMRAGGG